MLPNVGRVEEFGHERGLTDARKLGQMPEGVFAVEFQAMGFLLLAGRRIAAQLHQNVVVEFAVVKNGDATAGLAIRTDL